MLVSDPASDNEESEELDTKDKSLIGQLRNALLCIRWSPQRRQAFVRSCTLFETSIKMPKLDVNTRWNSTLAMMLRT